MWVFLRNTKNFAAAMFVLAATLWASSEAVAATMFVAPNTGSFSVGDTFDVGVRVASPDQSFNSAQAAIAFTKTVLNVKSISAAGADSVFDFWLDNPSFSNSDGTITFTGGASNGVAGPSVPLIRVTFVAVGSGQATVSITDAAIIAADGSGQNILSRVSGGAYSVVPSNVALATTTAIANEAPAASTASSTSGDKLITITPTKKPQIAVVAPTIIKRQAVAVKTEPIAPKITIGLYPDATAWYNTVANFLAEWDLPLDVTDVAVAVNADPNYAPAPTDAQGLIAAKTFPALPGDGIWYLHVRFKNNVGWGPAAHYRIAIDTVPPDALVIDSDSGFTTDNPAPTLHLKATDGLSGLGYFQVSVDSGGFVVEKANTHIMPILALGEHALTVRAVDNAGNARERTVVLKILPREAPLLVIAGFKLGKTLFFSLIILALLGAFAGGWFVYRARERQTNRKVIIAERDVMNTFAQIESDVDRMLQYYTDNKLDTTETQEIEVYLKKIKDNIKKSQKYIIENIKEIGD